MYPVEFLENMMRQLGDEYTAFASAMEGDPVTGLRVNPARREFVDSISNTACEFNTQSMLEGRVPWFNLGWYTRRGTHPGSTLEHFCGAFYVQEPSAMAPVAALDPRPGELVLDLCAAPGGKSTQIGALMGGRGALVSNEPDYRRAKVLYSNIERMGITNASVISALPEQLAPRFKGTFDAVLVDAPCSGEGMFRRDAQAVSQWNPAAPEGCARRQAGILDSASQMVAPGGRLVYSTCTLNERENEEVISNFLRENPDFEPWDFELAGVGRSQGGTLKLWPHRIKGEGHFVARMIRNGQRAGAPARRSSLVSGIPELEDMCRMDFLDGMSSVQIGDFIYAIPDITPDLNGMHVISPGLKLMKRGRSHIEPAHSLAMAGGIKCVREIDLDQASARAFARGEAVNCSGDLRGWTLVKFKNLPLGWGKAVDGMLKNHVPSGIRLRQ